MCASNQNILCSMNDWSTPFPPSSMLEGEAQAEKKSKPTSDKTNLNVNKETKTQKSTPKKSTKTTKPTGTTKSTKTTKTSKKSK